MKKFKLGISYNGSESSPHKFIKLYENRIRKPDYEFHIGIGIGTGTVKDDYVFIAWLILCAFSPHSLDLHSTVVGNPPPPPH